MTGPSTRDRRFHPRLTDQRRWIRERSHESYAKNYSVVFPHDEPLAGRNMRTDPLHEVPPPDERGDPQDAQGTGVTGGHVAPQCWAGETMGGSVIPRVFLAECAQSPPGCWWQGP